MLERRTQFTFKSKREHIAKVNIPNLPYSNKQINIYIPHGSSDHCGQAVIVLDTVKIMFNLENESADKVHSIADNTGRALVNKKVLIFGSKEIDTINNTGCYDTYKDIF